MEQIVEQHAADSSAQREVEAWAVEHLAQTHPGLIRGPKLFLSDGACITLDAADRADLNLTIACEIYARVGSLKGSQPKKLATDVLKLALLQSERGRANLPSARLVMAVVDDFAFTALMSDRSWLGTAVRNFGIEVAHLPLPADLRLQVVAAQNRQGSRRAYARRARQTLAPA